MSYFYFSSYPLKNTTPERYKLIKTNPFELVHFRVFSKFSKSYQLLMQFEYYSLPLCLENLILKNDMDEKDPEALKYQQGNERTEKFRKQLSKCSLQQSVIQHVHLLLTTAFGEFPADENFGCGIWEHDFDAVSSAHKVKEAIRQSLLQSVQEKEKRLSNPRVELTIVQEEQSEFAGVKSIKKRIDVLVNGILQVTNERFQFRDTFFVGPLSY